MLLARNQGFISSISAERLMGIVGAAGESEQSAGEFSNDIERRKKILVVEPDAEPLLDQRSRWALM
jgi:hypothetical protein